MKLCATVKLQQPRLGRVQWWGENYHLAVSFLGERKNRAGCAVKLLAAFSQQ